MSGILSTDTILDKIVAQKIKEVEILKGRPGRKGPSPSRSDNPGDDFLNALKDKDRPGRPIIAEIKKASPSAGVLRDPFEPKKIAAAYEKNGARCISVITDEEFFKGSLEVLEQVRGVTHRPILRKDFIIHPIQIEDAAKAGADAVLLIARILSDDLLKWLYECAEEMKLAVLFEAHDERDMERIAGLSPVPSLIGVNNRDLSDFSVSIDRTLSLLPMMPEGAVVVSESGLSDAGVLDDLAAAGVHAFLIGTAFMKADDPGEALRRLVDL